MIDRSGESEWANGRAADPATTLLRLWAMTWQDAKQQRLAAMQRHLPERYVKMCGSLEEAALRQLKKAWAQHPLWPWLSQFPGLGGAHTAIVISAIADPRKFPGQRCSVGHYHAPGLEVGSPCPYVAERAREVEDTDGDEDAGAVVAGCPGVMLPPRLGTGVRSVWHYLGLHVEEGRSPRKRKGQRVSWHPVARASVLQPDGIADQIIKWKPQPYRDTYDAMKERLLRERGVVEPPVEIEATTGDPSETAERVEYAVESATCHGPLRLIQAHDIARKVAAKQFIGDAVVEWKRLLSERWPEIDHGAGEQA